MTDGSVVNGPDEGPPRDELEADFGSGSPVPAAWKWLQLVIVVGDISAAWPLTDPNLRLALVQEVLGDTFDQSAGPWVLDQHAWALAQDQPTHPDWSSVQDRILGFLRAHWQSERPPGEWGALRPRVIDASHELVLFMPEPPEGNRLPASGFADTYPILMAMREAQWLVAGFLDRPPTPGWPPKWPTADGPLDMR